MIGLVVGISLLSLFFVGSRVSKSTTKSGFLISISIVSTSLWIFALSSLAFCMMFVDQYWASPISAILLVARLALGLSATLGVASMLLFRSRALSGIYRSIKEQSITIESEDGSNTSELASRLIRAFKVLGSKIGQVSSTTVTSSQPIVLSNQSRLAPSLAFDWGDSKIVAIKENVVQMLDDDELETVVAHELGHIRYRDALQKSIATAYKVAFPFDIVARLVEAAIYRQRELEADDFSVQLTRKPVSLASALLKIYENIQIRPLQNVGQVSYLVNTSRSRRLKRGNLFSKEPPIGMRIERLLRVATSEN